MVARSQPRTAPHQVALLAEGVDRNWAVGASDYLKACRPPRGGRG